MAKGSSYFIPKVRAELKKVEGKSITVNVKFKDADLIGYPIRITVGPKAIAENQIETKVRRSGETLTFTKETYLAEVTALLKTL